MNAHWPDIPYGEWRETSVGLHLWLQIAGKYRLALTPWLNHSWHATFYVVPRGLTTGPVHDGGKALTLMFDLIEHRFIVETSHGQSTGFALEAMSVAAFHDRVRDAVTAVGGVFTIHGVPNEVPDAQPFADDRAERPYDAAAVERFHAALIQIDRVFARFRTGFLGKVSPVHLFWGSFDLAVTRFSGRRAPLHPGGVAGLPDAITREAYSHEVSSAGFWPGEGAGEPMFYSYAYPAADGYKAYAVEPAEARWDEALGEFLLPYRAVRESPDPEAMLLRFLATTYEAAADTGEWDRSALECSIGIPGEPRAIGGATSHLGVSWRRRGRFVAG